MAQSDKVMPVNMSNGVKSHTISDNSSIGQLTLYFIAWKALLLIVASASPGRGYDTSTQILLDHDARSPQSWSGRVLQHCLLRLTRWDGIYFASNSERGHVNEQDWAFSWALARVTSSVAEGAYSCKADPEAAAKLSTYFVL